MNRTDPTQAAAAVSPDLLARLAARGVTPADDLDDPRTETPEQAAERRALQARNRASRWIHRRPVMYQDASVTDLVGDAEQAHAAEQANAWWSRRGACTLLVAGSVGTGKTHLAYALGNRAVAEGRWVEVWTQASLLEDLRPSGDPTADDRARRCDLLILDDLAALNVSPWASETLTAILDARVAAGLRQVVTTNVTAADIEAAWGGRFMDRLVYHSVPVKMVGASRRRGAW